MVSPAKLQELQSQDRLSKKISQDIAQEDSTNSQQLKEIDSDSGVKADENDKSNLAAEL